MHLSRLWQEAVSSSKWYSVVCIFHNVQQLAIWPWLLHLVDTPLYIQAISLETKCPSTHAIIDLCLYLHVPSLVLWFAKNTPYIFEMYFHITEQEKKFVSVIQFITIWHLLHLLPHKFKTVKSNRLYDISGYQWGNYDG